MDIQIGCIAMQVPRGTSLETYSKPAALPVSRSGLNEA